MRPLLAAIVVAALLPTAARAADVADVDPFVGTGARVADIREGGGAGATVPGAAVPFGLVQMSPETAPATSAFGAGYAWEDDRMRGFSPTHVSGTGCAVFGDVPVLPLARAASAPPAPTALPRFSHDGESASAGAYDVVLGGVRVALTATARVGVLRMTFPRGRPATVLIDAGGSQTGDDRAAVRIDPARGEVVATARGGRFCGKNNIYDVHVVARFDVAPDAWGIWERGRVRAGATSASDTRRATGGRAVPGGLPVAPVRGARAGAYLRFAPGATVEARLGVSFLDAAGARRNLDAEAGNARSFAALRAAARAAWARQLARVRGGPGGATFATALYHALLHPNLIGDADGRYPGPDGRVRRARGWAPRSTIAGWDIYRTQFPLLAMAFPEQARDVVRTLTQGRCAPRWALAGRETDVMVGEPGAILLAEALAFAVPGIDRARTLAVARRTLAPPCRSADGGAAGVLERAVADYAVGVQARDDAMVRRARAAIAGLALASRDPASTAGLVEGSAAQYLFAAPFDLTGVTVDRLTPALARLDGGPFDPFAGLGNEPSFAIPWFGALLGRQDLTDDAVARGRALFAATPAGLPGNDDAGALSAWFVLAALGRYPAVPGTDRLVRTTPLVAP
jgi:predicted alpha-1,2-mannosidase